MTSSNEFLVIKPKNRIVAIQKIGMENDFDAIVAMVEKFDSTNLVENGVANVIGHIVSDDGR